MHRLSKFARPWRPNNQRNNNRVEDEEDEYVEQEVRVESDRIEQNQAVAEEDHMEVGQSENGSLVSSPWPASGRCLLLIIISNRVSRFARDNYY